MSAYRFRRCPRCQWTGPGGAYRPAGRFRPGWREQGTMRRTCPNCGHIAQTRDFPVVSPRERVRA